MANIKISAKAQRIAKRIINGLEVKYDFDIHIPILVELFAKGHDVAAFCSEAEIARSTFFKWVETHPEFERAYEVAVECARIWWENQILDNGALVELDGVKFNTKLWTMIMKNRFGFSDHRTVKLPKLKQARDFVEQVKVLAEYAADGDLSSQEASYLSNLILAAVKVEESSKIKQKIEELEALVASKI